MTKRGKDIQKQIIERKLREGKYNRKYRKAEKEKGPKYLKECNKGNEIRLKARAKCGNLETANKYWLGEEEKKCQLCEKGLGNWGHYIVECEVVGEWTGETEGTAREKIRMMTEEGRNKETLTVLEKLDREIKIKEKEGRNARSY